MAAYSYTEAKRFRKNFGRQHAIMNPPALLEVQTNSYRDFLYNEDESNGLEGAFESIFPITAISGVASLEYVSHRFGKPAFDVNECHLRGVTYAAPLRVKVR